MKSTTEITNLIAEPYDEWRRMLHFVQWGDAARQAVMPTIEALLSRAREMVVGTYDYLAHTPETAAVLGWEDKIDPQHLEERRRFFAIWLSRTLGLDTSEEMAYYLFRAGKFHAKDGPRQIHVPETYVTGAISMMLSAFASCLADAKLSGEVIASAMSAWSRYLNAHLNQMLLGYRAAQDMKRGVNPIQCLIFGKLRPVIQTAQTVICTDDGAPVSDLLRKFFNYYPQARKDALEPIWIARDKNLWREVQPNFKPRYGWRVLLNGRDLEYAGGFETPLSRADEISIFPPGR